MLDATGRISLGSSAYALHVALERRFRIVTVFRDGLVWDTRILPRSIRPAQDRFYVLLEGEVQLFDESRRVVTRPCAFRVRASEEAEGERRRVDVRASGRPFRLLEIHLWPPSVGVDEDETWTELAMSPALLAACDHYEREARDGRGASVTDARARLLDELVRAGWLSPDALAAIPSEEPTRLARTWGALAPVFRDLVVSPALIGLADRASVSLRQVDRDFVELLGTFGFGNLGWRGTMQRFRLSLAVVMLSADDATVTDVARMVGYARAEAMTSAFRTAGLPAPRVVQRVLRDGEPP